MNKLHEILTELRPTLSYRIKFAFEPSKEQMLAISTKLNDRYDAFNIGALIKTIFQVNPIDFPNIDCGEIWYFDFECTKGVQPDLLATDICSLIKANMAFVKVRNNNEPFQVDVSSTEDETDIVFDEVYDDIDSYVGQQRVDDVLKKERKSLYSEYMAGSFGKDD